MEGKEEDAEPQHCLHFGVLGGGVYCRGTGGRWDQEEGGMRGGGGQDRKEAVPVLRHQVADCVCVRVLTQSKSICPLWNCGHREGKGVQTQPGHMQAGTSKYSAG